MIDERRAELEHELRTPLAVIAGYAELLAIRDDAPPAHPGVSPRIGLAPEKGDGFPYRFYVAGDENVSAKPR